MQNESQLFYRFINCKIKTRDHKSRLKVRGDVYEEIHGYT